MAHSNRIIARTPNERRSFRNVFIGVAVALAVLLPNAIQSGIAEADEQKAPAGLVDVSVTQLVRDDVNGAWVQGGSGWKFSATGNTDSTAETTTDAKGAGQFEAPLADDGSLSLQPLLSAKPAKNAHFVPVQVANQSTAEDAEDDAAEDATWTAASCLNNGEPVELPKVASENGQFATDSDVAQRIDGLSAGDHLECVFYAEVEQLPKKALETGTATVNVHRVNPDDKAQGKHTPWSHNLAVAAISDDPYVRVEESDEEGELSAEVRVDASGASLVSIMPRPDNEQIETVSQDGANAVCTINDEKIPFLDSALPGLRSAVNLPDSGIQVRGLQPDDVVDCTYQVRGDVEVPTENTPLLNDSGQTRAAPSLLFHLEFRLLGPTDAPNDYLNVPNTFADYEAAGYSPKLNKNGNVVIGGWGSSQGWVFGPWNKPFDFDPKWGDWQNTKVVLGFNLKADYWTIPSYQTQLADNDNAGRDSSEAQYMQCDFAQGENTGESHEFFISGTGINGRVRLKPEQPWNNAPQIDGGGPWYTTQDQKYLIDRDGEYTIELGLRCYNTVSVSTDWKVTGETPYSASELGYSTGHLEITDGTYTYSSADGSTGTKYTKSDGSYVWDGHITETVNYNPAKDKSKGNCHLTDIGYDETIASRTGGDKHPESPFGMQWLNVPELPLTQQAPSPIKFTVPLGVGRNTIKIEHRIECDAPTTTLTLDKVTIEADGHVSNTPGWTFNTSDRNMQNACVDEQGYQVNCVASTGSPYYSSAEMKVTRKGWGDIQETLLTNGDDYQVLDEVTCDLPASDWFVYKEGDAKKGEPAVISINFDPENRPRVNCTFTNKWIQPKATHIQIDKKEWEVKTYGSNGALKSTKTISDSEAAKQGYQAKPVIGPNRWETTFGTKNKFENIPGINKEWSLNDSLYIGENTSLNATNGNACKMTGAKFASTPTQSAASVALTESGAAWGTNWNQFNSGDDNNFKITNYVSCYEPKLECPYGTFSVSHSPTSSQIVGNTFTITAQLASGSGATVKLTLDSGLTLSSGWATQTIPASGTVSWTVTSNTAKTYGYKVEITDGKDGWNECSDTSKTGSVTFTAKPAEPTGTVIVEKEWWKDHSKVGNHTYSPVTIKVTNDGKTQTVTPGQGYTVKPNTQVTIAEDSYTLPAGTRYVGVKFLDANGKEISKNADGKSITLSGVADNQTSKVTIVNDVLTQVACESDSSSGLKTTLTVDKTSPNLNDPVRFTATVRDTAGNAVQGVVLMLVQGSTTYSEQTTNASGVASWYIEGKSSAGTRAFALKIVRGVGSEASVGGARDCATTSVTWVDPNAGKPAYIEIDKEWWKDSSLLGGYNVNGASVTIKVDGVTVTPGNSTAVTAGKTVTVEETAYTVPSGTEYWRTKIIVNGQETITSKLNVTAPKAGETLTVKVVNDVKTKTVTPNTGSVTVSKQWQDANGNNLTNSEAASASITVTVAGKPQTITGNGSVTFTGVASGNQTVTESDLKAPTGYSNPTAVGSTSKNVNVETGKTVSTSFTNKATKNAETNKRALYVKKYVCPQGQTTCGSSYLAEWDVTVANTSGNRPVTDPGTKKTTSGGVAWSIEGVVGSKAGVKLSETMVGDTEFASLECHVDGQDKGSVVNTTSANISGNTASVTFDVPIPAGNLNVDCYLYNRVKAPPQPDTGSVTVSKQWQDANGNNLSASEAKGAEVKVTVAGQSKIIEGNGSVTFEDVAKGSQTVTESALKAPTGYSNPTAVGGTSKSVNVPAGGSTSTSFTNKATKNSTSNACDAVSFVPNKTSLYVDEASTLNMKVNGGTLASGTSITANKTNGLYTGSWTSDGVWDLPSSFVGLDNVGPTVKYSVAGTVTFTADIKLQSGETCTKTASVTWNDKPVVPVGPVPQCAEMGTGAWGDAITVSPSTQTVGNNVTVTAEILDLSDKPISGVQVKLLAGGKEVGAQKATDSSGKASWTITGDKAGSVTYTLRVVSVPGNSDPTVTNKDCDEASVLWTDPKPATVTVSKEWVDIDGVKVFSTAKNTGVAVTVGGVSCELGKPCEVPVGTELVVKETITEVPDADYDFVKADLDGKDLPEAGLSIGSLTAGSSKSVTISNYLRKHVENVSSTMYLKKYVCAQGETTCSTRADWQVGASLAAGGTGASVADLDAAKWTGTTGNGATWKISGPKGSTAQVKLWEVAQGDKEFASLKCTDKTANKVVLDIVGGSMPTKTAPTKAFEVTAGNTIDCYLYNREPAPDTVTVTANKTWRISGELVANGKTYTGDVDASTLAGVFDTAFKFGPYSAGLSGTNTIAWGKSKTYSRDAFSTGFWVDETSVNNLADYGCKWNKVFTQKGTGATDYASQFVLPEKDNYTRGFNVGSGYSANGTSLPDSSTLTFNVVNAITCTPPTVGVTVTKTWQVEGGSVLSDYNNKNVNISVTGGSFSKLGQSFEVKKGSAVTVTETGYDVPDGYEFVRLTIDGTSKNVNQAYSKTVNDKTTISVVNYVKKKSAGTASVKVTKDWVISGKGLFIDGVHYKAGTYAYDSKVGKALGSNAKYVTLLNDGTYDYPWKELAWGTTAAFPSDSIKGAYWTEVDVASELKTLGCSWDTSRGYTTVVKHGDQTGTFNRSLADAMAWFTPPSASGTTTVAYTNYIKCDTATVIVNKDWVDADGKKDFSGSHNKGVTVTVGGVACELGKDCEVPANQVLKVKESVTALPDSDYEFVSAKVDGSNLPASGTDITALKPGDKKTVSIVNTVRKQSGPSKLDCTLSTVEAVPDRLFAGEKTKLVFTPRDSQNNVLYDSFTYHPSLVEADKPDYLRPDLRVPRAPSVHEGPYSMDMVSQAAQDALFGGTITDDASGVVCELEPVGVTWVPVRIQMDVEWKFRTGDGAVVDLPGAKNHGELSEVPPSLGLVMGQKWTSKPLLTRSTKPFSGDLDVVEWGKDYAVDREAREYLFGDPVVMRVENRVDNAEGSTGCRMETSVVAANNGAPVTDSPNFVVAEDARYPNEVRPLSLVAPVDTYTVVNTISCDGIQLDVDWFYRDGSGTETRLEVGANESTLLGDETGVDQLAGQEWTVNPRLGRPGPGGQSVVLRDDVAWGRLEILDQDGERFQKNDPLRVGVDIPALGADAAGRSCRLESVRITGINGESVALDDKFVLFGEAGLDVYDGTYVPHVATRVNLYNVANVLTCDDPEGFVAWNKTDGATGDLLGGSKWQISGVGESSGFGSITVNDCVGKDAADCKADDYDLDPVMGAFKVKLPEGTYQLVEVEAPLGFAKSDQVYSVTVNGDTSVVRPVDEQGEIVTDIENWRIEVSVTLPLTGEKSLLIILLGGLALIGVAIWSRRSAGKDTIRV